MYRYFKSLRIDDWKASLLVKDIVYGWQGQEIRVNGMLRLFPEWRETTYKSPTGELISLTLKFSSYKDLVINKFSMLKEGDLFYVKGTINSNYINKSNPDFEGETKFAVTVEDIYSDDKNIFSSISNVAVLITS